MLKSRGVAGLSVVETNPHRAAALQHATGIVAISAEEAQTQTQTHAQASAGGLDLRFRTVGVAAPRELAIADAAPGSVGAAKILLLPGT